jgi:hypothetical protein
VLWRAILRCAHFRKICKTIVRPFLLLFRIEFNLLRLGRLVKPDAHSGALFSRLNHLIFGRGVFKTVGIAAIVHFAVERRLQSHSHIPRVQELTLCHDCRLLGKLKRKGINDLPKVAQLDLKASFHHSCLTIESLLDVSDQNILSLDVSMESR